MTRFWNGPCSGSHDWKSWLLLQIPLKLTMPLVRAPLSCPNCLLKALCPNTFTPSFHKWILGFTHTQTIVHSIPKYRECPVLCAQPTSFALCGVSFPSPSPMHPNLIHADDPWTGTPRLLPSHLHICLSTSVHFFSWGLEDHFFYNNLRFSILLLSSFLVGQLQPFRCCPFSIYETRTYCDLKAWIISVASLFPCSQPVVHPIESNHLFQNISSGFRQFSSFKKNVVLVLEMCSTGKNTCCSSKGSTFVSQDPHLVPRKHL